MIFFTRALLVFVFFLLHFVMQAQDTLSSDTVIKRKLTFKFGPSVIRSNFISDYFGQFGTTGTKENNPGKFPNEFVVSGLFRFVTIYRNMDEAYPDMQTGKKNISFLDYPLSDISSSGGVGNPILSLTLTSKVHRNADFRISYALSHLFTGTAANETNKFFTSTGGMAFEGNIRSSHLVTNLRYGGLLTLRTTRLVFDAPKYRDNFFDRLVSNQFSVSGQEGVYNKDADGKSFQWAYVKGAIAKLTFPDLNKLYLVGMLGRSPHTAVGAHVVEYFPAINYLVRAGYPLNIGSSKAEAGLSYYARRANENSVNGVIDNFDLFSADMGIGLFNIVKVNTEIGVSRIDNPLVETKKPGGAFIINGTLDKRILRTPVFLEYYNVSHEFGNLDGEILNTNTGLRDGGITASGQYDQTTFINVGQEVGLVANNRAGISLRSTFQLGNLKAEISYGVSQEKKNIYDTITFQHRVNAFSRSRFFQWNNNTGPYGRVKNIFARTFEYIAITDVESDYKKGFNNAELLLKYQFSVLNKKIILINFNNFISFQDHLSAAPVISDKAFIRTFFEDFTLMLFLSKKFMVTGNFGYERVWGNERVTLSPDKILNENGDPYSDKERTLNQTGTAYGLGWSYDVTTRLSMHFRHKWMSHKDPNFFRDVFKGQESTIEIKMLL